jgi:transcriptional regulator with XRE-family HTH domain
MTKNSLKQLEKMTGGRLTLGRLIWALRQADDMTQIEFAKKLGITKQHLCDIEHDRKSVSPKLAAKYAEILGYAKEQFIKLALQDLLDRDGLNIKVEIIVEKRKKSKNDRRLNAMKCV